MVPVAPSLAYWNSFSLESRYLIHYLYLSTIKDAYPPKRKERHKKLCLFTYLCPLLPGLYWIYGASWHSSSPNTTLRFSLTHRHLHSSDLFKWLHHAQICEHLQKRKTISRAWWWPQKLAQKSISSQSYKRSKYSHKMVLLSLFFTKRHHYFCFHCFCFHTVRILAAFFIIALVINHSLDRGFVGNPKSLWF